MYSIFPSFLLSDFISFLLFHLYSNSYLTHPLQDLVTKVFQQMWFTPDSSGNQEALLQRVEHMTDVVCSLYTFLIYPVIKVGSQSVVPDLLILRL